MPADYEMILRCIEEVDRELVRIAAERCDFLRQETQLSGVLLLLLRSTLLFRSMVELLRSRHLDAFNAVHRAFLESWLLAFQFRLKDSADEVGRWLARRPGSWSPRVRQLEEYARSRGHGAPNLGRDYGQLSELAHPTRNAAENSVALVTARLGVSDEEHMLVQEITALEESLPAMLYRIVWLVLDEHQDFIALHVDERNVPSAVQFVEQHPTR